MGRPRFNQKRTDEFVARVSDSQSLRRGFCGIDACCQECRVVTTDRGKTIWIRSGTDYPLQHQIPECCFRFCRPGAAGVSLQQPWVGCRSKRNQLAEGAQTDLAVARCCVRSIPADVLYHRDCMEPSLPALIADAESGSVSAADALFSALYAELHRLARRELARQGLPISLGATTLLHQAYIEMASRDEALFTQRAAFMG